MAVTGFTGFQGQNLSKLEIAPVTGSTTILAAPYDWLVFTNPGTIAAQTVTLPVYVAATSTAGVNASGTLVDGQTFYISNFAAITSFSFSVAVTGWTNTSALPAGQGLVVAYSVPSAVWFVMNY